MPPCAPLRRSQPRARQHARHLVHRRRAQGRGRAPRRRLGHGDTGTAGGPADPVEVVLVSRVTVCLAKMRVWACVGRSRCHVYVRTPLLLTVLDVAGCLFAC